MIFLLHIIDTFLGSNPVLFTIYFLAVILKIFLFCHLVRATIHSEKINQPLLFLGCVIFASMISDFTWVFVLSRMIFFPNIDYRIIIFLVRIAWGFSALQYQAMGFLIESLVNRTARFSLFQKILASISAGFCIFFVITAIFNFNCLSDVDRLPMEYTIETIIPLYCLFILLLPNLITAWRHVRQRELPLILKQQIVTLIKWLLVPKMISDFIQTAPQMGFYKPLFLVNSFSFSCISVIFSTAAFYFCAKKLIGLRFLTFKSPAPHPDAKLTFVHDFKNTLNRLSTVTTLEELSHITQMFFKDTLQVPFNKTKLFLRKIDNNTDEELEQPNPVSMEPTALVEAFLAAHQNALLNALKESPVLMHDEIAFTNFYNPTDTQTTLLQFLDALGADLFLPLFESQTLTGYIIIERHARSGNNLFYTNLERDEMIVFATYLSAIMNIIKNKNLELLIAREQQLKNTLYEKINEIDQFKESIRSFVRNNNHNQIGVITYQNRFFTPANAAAKEMIAINLNTFDGHPIVNTFKRIVTFVEEYKLPYQDFITDINGNSLVVHGMPHLEKQMIVITVAHPTVSDIVMRHGTQLKDPSDWDYLLYLETTRSGRLISTLIPSSGPVFLQFKIELLKAALSTKAILVDAPHEDLEGIVQLLHVVSMRESLHTIVLEKAITDSSMAIRLFGINPLLAESKIDQQPLLAQCGNESTIFIRNIHYLDLETQSYLADFIKYGVFRMYKSDRKIPSAARIVCSTDRDLLTLVQEGKFSRNLYEELHTSKIRMPSLITVPEEELKTLVDGYSSQVLTDDTLQELISLSDKDKEKVSNVRPDSLESLKYRVQQMMVSKSKKKQLPEEPQFNPAYAITDPDLMQAKLLGKRALRDRKIMIMLWRKFKNQSDIAKFLNVDRSSVWRRCKVFDLE